MTQAISLRGAPSRILPKKFAARFSSKRYPHCSVHFTKPFQEGTIGAAWGVRHDTFEKTLLGEMDVKAGHVQLP
ncbi:MAG TPA: hypothetical protein VG963_26045 [Polyangiaceae bacterium]|nr:hypothetical protein [Polyangiaceae bacterium]